MMKIVFYSIILNHHQVNVADELWNLTNHNYKFVELTKCLDTKGCSKDFSKRPYLLRAWENTESFQKAMELAKTADVCVFSNSQSLVFMKERLKKGLLSFEMNERWLKKGIINLFSPRLIKNKWEYFINNWGKKPLYKLCMGAFVAKDDNFLHTFKNKCYKWGYFTSIKKIQNSKKNKIIKIIWVSRFIKWKHPELAIKMVKNLIISSYAVKLDMYGEGDLKIPMQNLVKKLKLENVITFKGKINNEVLISKMAEYDIALLTSDKQEGWGAVANEFMSQGCALVGSNNVGSIPYLIKEKETGLIFKDRDINSLTEKVKWLIDNPEQRKQIQNNAIELIQNTWSPANAARSFLQLINDLKEGKETSILEGPCSKA